MSFLVSAVSRCQSLRREDVPVTFHEVGIHSGYRRPYCSLLECVVSAFYPTNETWNFWTHFIPFWYFLGSLMSLLLDPKFVGDSYNWPFLVYMLTASSWPLVSCLAHLLSVMSENARHICFFVDYCTLSWYSFGVSVVYQAYAIDESLFHSWYTYKKLYVWASAGASWFCVVAACSSRFIGSNTRLRKRLRLLAFFVPYSISSFPLLLRILYCEYNPECADVAILLHRRQFLWAVVGIALYGLHFPESLFPGCFDIWFHSHQMFHVSGVLATYDQLNACYMDLNERRRLMVATRSSSDGRFLLAMTVAVLLVNIAILRCFIDTLLFGTVQACPSVEQLSERILKTDDSTQLDKTDKSQTLSATQSDEAHLRTKR